LSVGSERAEGCACMPSYRRPAPPRDAVPRARAPAPPPAPHAVPPAAHRRSPVRPAAAPAAAPARRRRRRRLLARRARNALGTAAQCTRRNDSPPPRTPARVRWRSVCSTKASLVSRCVSARQASELTIAAMCLRRCRASHIQTPGARVRARVRHGRCEQQLLIRVRVKIMGSIIIRTD
jgi:hypothetical protein